MHKFVVLYNYGILILMKYFDINEVELFDAKRLSSTSTDAGIELTANRWLNFCQSVRKDSLPNSQMSSQKVAVR